MFKKLLSMMILMVLTLVSILEASTHQQEYIVNRTDHAQLFKKNINAIVQDATGFIWFATDSGLLRYDGNDVITFRHNPEDPNSLPANVIQSANIDVHGNLWVGSTRGALSLYRPETNDFENFKPDPNRSFDFRRIRNGADNSLWIGSVIEPVIYRFSLETRSFNAIEIPKQSDRNVLFAFDILERSNGEIWIATVEDGIVVLNENYEQIASYTAGEFGGNNLLGNSLRTLAEDPYGNIWIGGFGAHLSRFNPETETFSSPDPSLFNSLTNVYDFSIDPVNDVIRAAADGGLLIVELQSMDIKETYGFEPNNLKSLSNDRVRALLHDRNNILWVGNEHGGVHRLLRRNAFTHITPEPDDNTRLQNRYVRSFLQVNEQELWVANDNHIAVVDANTNSVIRLIRNLPGKQPETGITEMYKLHEGGYLIGTWGSGLIYYNPSNGNHTSFRSIEGDSTSISDNRIQIIHTDSKGRLWIGTENGLNLFDIDSGKFTRVLFDKDALGGTFNYSTQSAAFLESEDDIFWIGTWNGLIRFDLKTGSYETISIDSPVGKAIESNHVLSLHKCRDNFIWIGTFGGGLSRLDPQDGSIITITDSDGLASSVIFTIVPGTGSDVWLSTYNGLIRFDTKTQLFRNFNESDGLGIAEFWWGAGYKSPSNLIYFGSIYGYIQFNPENITESPFNPPVVMSELRLFEETIPLTKAADLSYYQNYLSFNYASLDFTNPSIIDYTHKLDGLDNDWIKTGNRSQVSYSAIPPGNYTFRVRATNSDGVWSTHEVALPIVISPPFWQTSSFYLLSLVFLALSIYGTIQWRTAAIADRNKLLEAEVSNRTRELARNQQELTESNEALKEKSERLEERTVEIEKQRNQLLESARELLQKNEQLEKINQEKNSLIGIVAHDLRSPLTSIMSAMEIIRMTPEMSRAEIDELHEMIEGFINKQLALIGRILDHQSLETGEISVNKVKQSIIPVLQNIIVDYQSQAESKKLNIRLIKPPAISELPLDENVFEQVIANLMSNAIKFSIPDGQITLTVLDTSSEIWVGICDNGPGISDTDKRKLFGKFQKLSAQPTGGEQSTGLGLSIVKKLTEAMNGRVWCESEPGEGATFWVALPKSEELEV
ncbi:MAG: hypothetical protein LAT52_00615 [Balneolales bacterium]|nr:hypothetical protein [Balneolales bacterium]